MTPAVYMLMFLDLILKGISLYKSAQRNQKIWFVALLMINSLGILPVIYLIIHRDIFSSRVKVSLKKSTKKAVKKTK